MKIIHVLNYFLPYNVAGTEVYVWTLCKHLQRQDCEVSVLIPNYEKKEADSYVYDEIKVVKYAEPSKSERVLITGQKVSEGVEFFKHYLEEEQPDIVHFHEIAGSNGISVAHLEAAKLLYIKVCFTMHLANATCSTGNLMYKQKVLCDGKINISKCAYCALQKRFKNDLIPYAVLAGSIPMYNLGINSLGWNNGLGTLLSYPFQVKNLHRKLKRIEHACDVIIPITNWYKDILLKNGISEKKIQTVLQALPTDAGLRNARIKNDQLPVKLIFIGRINELKGIRILIEALKHFTEQQVTVDIYGGTLSQEFMDDCILQTEPFRNIRWQGKLEQHEVLNTLEKYDALILPSLFSEMSPLVIQEAFAAGLPVIGSNVYGISEQVQDGVNGLLFTMGDVEALKSLLVRCVDNVHLLSTLADNVKPPRSFDMVAQEMIEIYKSVLTD